ncbi:hypothetical protein [Limnohabitans sp. TEGF004]|jgi:hypothetical protein|uniref:hypothetical protein n=1 Tax=Limnohabitans sp. TEGF004 TaxID=2986281 RepID=UPI0023775D86|nr:hypothetical protein [Limnohabitans sp. TEGF004]BDU56399.1 hypothetical protein LTEGF4_20800 [Limnohabitans sp. TEGF004]
MDINLNLIGMGLQLIGLGLAACRDIAKSKAERATGEIRETIYIDAYEAAKKGLIHEESTQEKISKTLHAFASKLENVLPYSIALAALGAALQIIAEINKN